MRTAADEAAPASPFAYDSIGAHGLTTIEIQGFRTTESKLLTVLPGCEARLETLEIRRLRVSPLRATIAGADVRGLITLSSTALMPLMVFDIQNQSKESWALGLKQGEEAKQRAREASWRDRLRDRVAAYLTGFGVSLACRLAGFELSKVEIRVENINVGEAPFVAVLRFAGFRLTGGKDRQLGVRVEGFEWEWHHAPKWFVSTSDATSQLNSGYLLASHVRPEEIHRIVEDGVLESEVRLEGVSPVSVDVTLPAFHFTWRVLRDAARFAEASQELQMWRSCPRVEKWRFAIESVLAWRRLARRRARFQRLRWLIQRRAFWSVADEKTGFENFLREAEEYSRSRTAPQVVSGVSEASTGPEIRVACGSVQLGHVRLSALQLEKSLAGTRLRLERAELLCLSTKTPVLEWLEIRAEVSSQSDAVSVATRALRVTSTDFLRTVLETTDHVARLTTSTSLEKPSLEEKKPSNSNNAKRDVRVSVSELSVDEEAWRVSELTLEASQEGDVARVAFRARHARDGYLRFDAMSDPYAAQPLVVGLETKSFVFGPPVSVVSLLKTYNEWAGVDLSAAPVVLPCPPPATRLVPSDTPECSLRIRLENASFGLRTSSQHVLSCAVEEFEVELRRSAEFAPARAQEEEEEEEETVFFRDALEEETPAHDGYRTEMSARVLEGRFESISLAALSVVARRAALLRVPSLAMKLSEARGSEVEVRMDQGVTVTLLPWDVRETSRFVNALTENRPAPPVVTPPASRRDHLFVPSFSLGCGASRVEFGEDACWLEMPSLWVTSDTRKGARFQSLNVEMAPVSWRNREQTWWWLEHGVNFQVSRVASTNPNELVVSVRFHRPLRMVVYGGHDDLTSARFVQDVGVLARLTEAAASPSQARASSASRPASSSPPAWRELDGLYVEGGVVSLVARREGLRFEVETQLRMSGREVFAGPGSLQCTECVLTCEDTTSELESPLLSSFLWSLDWSTDETTGCLLCRAHAKTIGALRVTPRRLARLSAFVASPWPSSAGTPSSSTTPSISEDSQEETVRRVQLRCFDARHPVRFELHLSAPGESSRPLGLVAALEMWGEMERRSNSADEDARDELEASVAVFRGHRVGSGASLRSVFRCAVSATSASRDVLVEPYRFQLEYETPERVDRPGRRDLETSARHDFPALGLIRVHAKDRLCVNATPRVLASLMSLSERFSSVEVASTAKESESETSSGRLSSVVLMNETRDELCAYATRSGGTLRALSSHPSTSSRVPEDSEASSTRAATASGWCHVWEERDSMWRKRHVRVEPLTLVLTSPTQIVSLEASDTYEYAIGYRSDERDSGTVFRKLWSASVGGGADREERERARLRDSVCAFQLRLLRKSDQTVVREMRFVARDAETKEQMCRALTASLTFLASREALSSPSTRGWMYLNGGQRCYAVLRGTNLLFYTSELTSEEEATVSSADALTWREYFGAGDGSASSTSSRLLIAMSLMYASTRSGLHEDDCAFVMRFSKAWRRRRVFPVAPASAETLFRPEEAEEDDGARTTRWTLRFETARDLHQWQTCLTRVVRDVSPRARAALAAAAVVSRGEEDEEETEVVVLNSEMKGIPSDQLHVLGPHESRRVAGLGSAGSGLVLGVRDASGSSWIQASRRSSESLFSVTTSGELSSLVSLSRGRSPEELVVRSRRLVENRRRDASLRFTTSFRAVLVTDTTRRRLEFESAGARLAGFTLFCRSKASSGLRPKETEFAWRVLGVTSLGEVRVLEERRDVVLSEARPSWFALRSEWSETRWRSLEMELSHRPRASTRLEGEEATLGDVPEDEEETASAGSEEDDAGDRTSHTGGGSGVSLRFFVSNEDPEIFSLPWSASRESLPLSMCEPSRALLMGLADPRLPWTLVEDEFESATRTSTTQRFALRDDVGELLGAIHRVSTTTSSVTFVVEPVCLIRNGLPWEVRVGESLLVSRGETKEMTARDEEVSPRVSLKSIRLRRANEEGGSAEEAAIDVERPSSTTNAPSGASTTTSSASAANWWFTTSSSTSNRDGTSEEVERVGSKRLLRFSSGDVVVLERVSSRAFRGGDAEESSEDSIEWPACYEVYAQAWFTNSTSHALWGRWSGESERTLRLPPQGVRVASAWLAEMWELAMEEEGGWSAGFRVQVGSEGSVLLRARARPEEEATAYARALRLSVRVTSMTPRDPRARGALWVRLSSFHLISNRLGYPVELVQARVLDEAPEEAGTCVTVVPPSETVAFHPWVPSSGVSDEADAEEVSTTLVRFRPRAAEASLPLAGRLWSGALRLNVVAEHRFEFPPSVHQARWANSTNTLRFRPEGSAELGALTREGFSASVGHRRSGGLQILLEDFARAKLLEYWIDNRSASVCLAVSQGHRTAPLFVPPLTTRPLIWFEPSLESKTCRVAVFLRPESDEDEEVLEPAHVSSLEMDDVGSTVVFGNETWRGRVTDQPAREGETANPRRVFEFGGTLV